MRSHDIPILAVALLVAVGAACSDRKTLAPGKICIINSDCENPLSCSFGKCHEACKQNGDCPAGQRCVFAPIDSDGGAIMSGGGDAGEMRVCLLLDQENCAYDSVCPYPLVCGRDLQCRNQCEADIDCPRATDRCVVGGRLGEKVCAEPQAIENDMVITVDGGDQLDADPPDAAKPDSAAPDAAAMLDAATSDAMTPDAATPDTPPDRPPTTTDAGAGTFEVAADVPAPADAPADAGVTADVGTTPDAAAPVDARPDLPTGPCGITEAEPNEDSATATPYTPNTDVVGCINMGVDLDFYEVIAPAGGPGNMAGGYFTGSLTGVGTGTITAHIVSGFDNGVILSYNTITVGQSIFFYWSARAGQKYYVQVAAYSGSSNRPPYKYTFRADYTPIADPYEPNDTSDTPAPITVGTPVTAYYFAGHKFATIGVAEYHDWYQVVLAPGTAMLRMQDVPHQTVLRYTVYDADFAFVGSARSGNAGAGFVGSVPVSAAAAAAGPFRILIDANPNGDAPTDEIMDVPDSFKRAYILTVTQ